MYSEGVTGLSTHTIFFLIVLVIIIGLRFRFFRRWLLFIIAIVPAFLLWVIGLLAVPLWRPISWVTDRLLRPLPIDHWISKLLLLSKKRARTPLLQGDRLAYAQSIWPSDEYPELYQAVPADLYRPPFEDGRLLGGIPLAWLADRHLNERVVRSAVRAGLKAGVVFFLLVAVLALIVTLLNIFDFFPALLSGERPIVERWPGDEPIRASIYTILIANAGRLAANLFANLAAFLVYIPATLVASVGVAILAAMLLLRNWMSAKGRPYELVTKDAEVRWPYRAETRKLIRRTYRGQLKLERDRLAGKPTFRIGTAFGMLGARGDPAAPVPGQALMLDSESLFQHTLVLGGTGEGKTTAILKPMLRQVFSHREFGAFLADAKGVLWNDAAKIARQLGRESDVLVVGTGANQFGVDITAGLNPTQIAAALRSVLTQMGGGNGNESFWPDMAASVMRHMLTIGRGYAQTEAGAAEATKKKLHPYSIWWAYQAVLRPEMSDNAIDHILATHAHYNEQIDEAATPDEIHRLTRTAKSFLPSELSDSMAYIQSAWRDMAKETKTGIIANVTNLMDGFGGSPILRNRFASGPSEGALNLRAALDGKLVLVALSSIEDGLPARLVTILLKTILYREARVREAEFKAQGLDPQTRPCLVVMDEVQEIVTVDPSSGLSDATFWNVARSTGLAGLFATQTLAALNQSMGENAASNFMQQTRSKVFFRSEEKGTVEYACWCAGEFERNRVYEPAERESLEYRLLIDGWDPLHPIDEEEELIGGPTAFFTAARGLLSPDRFKVGRATSRPTYGVDLRFIPKDGQGGGNAASVGALQQAFWRSEDLNRAYRSEGNSLQKALTPSDLIHMGRWHAFAQIQRAGAVRQDIIIVEPDYT